MVDNEGLQGHSSDTFEVIVNPPKPPSHLTPLTGSNTRIDLRWNDNSTSETHFSIERSENGTTWETIDEVPKNATIYRDRDLANNTKFHYRVRAKNDAGFSAYATPVAKTTRSRSTRPVAVLGEIGWVSRSQPDASTVHTIPTQNRYQTPIVVMGALTFNGWHPAHLRLLDYNRSSFSFYIEEWAYLDGEHTNERCSYLVVEQGSHQMPINESESIRVDANQAAVNNQWQTISFARPFDRAPIVVAGLIGNINQTPTVVRINKVSKTGFKARIQTEKPQNNGIMLAETIHWIAFEPDSGEHWQQPFITGVVPNVQHDKVNAPLVRFTTQKPVVLANVATFRGPDPVGVRYEQRGKHTVRVWLEEEQAGDLETGHITENVSYLAFLPGLLWRLR